LSLEVNNWMQALWREFVVLHKHSLTHGSFTKAEVSTLTSLFLRILSAKLFPFGIDSLSKMNRTNATLHFPNRLNKLSVSNNGKVLLFCEAKSKDTPSMLNSAQQDIARRIKWDSTELNGVDSVNYLIQLGHKKFLYGTHYRDGSFKELIQFVFDHEMYVR
jgi:hypothetical protein